MSSAGSSTETRVAGFAWQLQKLGPPGKADAGAFTSPFSLYVALALALRGTGKGVDSETQNDFERVVVACYLRASAYHPVKHPCMQLSSHTPWPLPVSHTATADPDTHQQLPDVTAKTNPWSLYINHTGHTRCL